MFKPTTCFAILLLTSQLSAAQLPPVSQNTWNYLNQVYKALDNDDYSRALAALDKAIKQAPGSQYERALIWRTQGSVYQLAGKPEKAAHALNQALDTHALPMSMAVQTAMELAGNLLARRQYKPAISLLQHWISESPDPPANLHILLAKIYTQQANYAKAVEPLYAALRKNPAPPDDWHRLAVAIHYELKQYGRCIPFLKKLMDRHPGESRYWLQLSSVHQLNKQPLKAIAVLEAAHAARILTGKRHLLRLASLYLEQDMPNKAAWFLDDVLKTGRLRSTAYHWSLLAHSWRQARELPNASEALRKAASLSDDGKLWVQLAYLYQEQENWEKCHAAARAALKKDNLQDPGKAHMLLGIASTHLDKPAAALTAFRAAKNFENTEPQASQWLNWLDSNLIGANL